MIKNILTFAIIIFNIFLWFTFANYEDFVSDIDNTWYDIESILEQEVVSRYDMARFLNYVDCHDCTVASPDLRDRLDADWFASFQNEAWKNFDDIIFDDTVYAWEEQYWCVAYAWYNDYLNWYPAESSPWCPWKFCGSNNTSYAEFIQAVFNVVSQNVYYDYTVNWRDVKNWMDSLDENSYEYSSLNFQDRQNINEEYERCWSWNCNAASPDTFSTYMKYCTYNVSECWFREFSIWEWNWPVAEINVLRDSDIFTVNDINNLDLDSFISWYELVYYLSSVNSVVWCDFEFDYSWDWVLNHLDNCPYHYNPNQSDMSWDWVWDVCSDDISWDWYTNPVWLVDDQWNVDPQLWDESEDVCPLHYNPDQDPNNCIDWDIFWLSITADRKFWTTNLDVNFDAEVVWDIENIHWDFWNWRFWQGVSPSTTYTEEWKYTVVARWTSPEWDTVSSSLTINVSEWDSMGVSYQANCDPKTWVALMELTCENDYSWDVDTVVWIVDWEEYELWVDEDFNHELLSPWDYEIEAIAYDSNWDQVWESSLNIWVIWDEPWYSYQANCDPKTWVALMELTCENDYSWDVDTVVWIVDWEEYELWVDEDFNHELLSPWDYEIEAIAYDSNWDQVWESSLNVSVSDPDLESEQDNFWSELFVDNLEPYEWETVGFETYIEWFSDDDIESIYWDFWDGNSWFDSLSTSHIYQSSWSYLVEQTIVLEDGTVLENKLTINVSSDLQDQHTVWSSLVSDNLNPSTDQSVNFDTEINWFSEDDIVDIYWDFWDWNWYSFDWLSASHVYDSVWTYLVEQTITLQDWTILRNTLTINVSEDLENLPWIDLSASTLESNVWDNIDFQANLENLDFSNIESIEWLFWDWNNFFYDNNWDENLSNSHFYNTSWKYTVRVHVDTSNYWLLSSSLSINVEGQSVCAMPPDELNEQFQCDMSWNWIPDICDTDISWDWYGNLLWIIQYEEFDEDGNCIYTEDNVDLSRLQEHHSLAESNSSYDNCPFVYNPEQLDSTWDWIWDDCEWMFDLDIDEDDDIDWIDFWDYDDSINISAVNCNACPCHFADFDSDIEEWDLIRALLFDPSWDIFYRASEPFRVWMFY